MYRLLRGLASLGLFAEDADESFRLTPLADLLRFDRPDSLRSMALFILDPYWWSTTGELLHWVRTGQPAPQHMYGVDEWEYLAQHRESAAVFQAAMTANTLPQIPAILQAYDFSQMHRLVDIGGGHGALLAAVLRARSALDGVLFDRAEVLEGANDPQPGKLLDIAMLTYNGGRERTATERQDLLGEAGLQLMRIMPTRASISKDLLLQAEILEDRLHDEVRLCASLREVRACVNPRKRRS
jgi:hypothetical protein